MLALYKRNNEDQLGVNLAETDLEKFVEALGVLKNHR